MVVIFRLILTYHHSNGSTLKYGIFGVCYQVACRIQILILFSTVSTFLFERSSSKNITPLEEVYKIVLATTMLQFSSDHDILIR